MTKPEKLTLRDIDASLAQAKAQVQQVNERYADVLARILKIEKDPRGHAPRAPVGEVEFDAVLGGAPVPAVSDGPSEYQTLCLEQAILQGAIDRGNKRVFDLVMQRAAFIFAQTLPEISALEKRRVLLATELLAVNRAREKLREQLRSQGCGGIPLPTDFWGGDILVAVGVSEDDVAWVQRRGLEDGIVTQAEIARASNG